jgi:hypothetical protein
VRINRWRHFPEGLKRHLQQRLLERKITFEDLDKLRIWIDSNPDLPAGPWFRDFGSFKIVGEGPNPLTFLTSEQVAFGEEISGTDEADSAASE